MSEKSLHRTLGISSSTNVSYYCEYSNLFALGQEVLCEELPCWRKPEKALHSLWVALPPHTNGIAGVCFHILSPGEVSKELGLRFPKSSSFHALPQICHPSPLVSTGHEIKEDGRGKRRNILNLKGNTRFLPQALSWISRS